MASIIQIGAKWRAQVRRKGAKPITKTHATKAAAQAWARRIEADIDAGTYRAETVETIDDLIEAYREMRDDSGRPVRDDSNQWYMLRSLSTGIGAIKASALDTERLVRWAQGKKRDGAGPYTINMHISLLGSVLRHVSSLKGLRLPDIVGEARPTLKYLHLIGGGGKRSRRPTAEELAALFEHWSEHPEIGPPMEDIIRLAIVVAFRRGEITRIEWRDFDRDRKMILVRDRKDPRKKEGNDQWIPLIGDAFAIIDRQPRRPGEPRIFPWSPLTISKYFTRACQALSIPDLHLHDCRHEAASALLEAGWAPNEVAVVTGHTTTVHLDRYINLDPAALLDKVVPIGKAKKKA